MRLLAATLVAMTALPQLRMHISFDSWVLELLT